MNGDLQPGPDRWTPDLLKVHYDSILKARDEETERTRKQMEFRLDGMNEFRESLNDLTGKFPTKAELRATVIAGAAFVSAVVAFLTVIK